MIIRYTPAARDDLVQTKEYIEKVLKNTKLIRETFIAKLSEEEKQDLIGRFGDVICFA